MSNKPPAALRPRWLALSHRADEIKAAMQRYKAEGLLCPDDWLIELQEIQRQLVILGQQVVLGQPKPEPDATPDFKPGQVWRTRNRGLCTIIEIDTSHQRICSNLYGSHWHLPNGKSCLSRESQDHEDDLVELIFPFTEASPEPEPEPEPVDVEFTPAAEAIPRRFVSISRTINKNGDHILDAIDDQGTAWWRRLYTSEHHYLISGLEPEWKQLRPLPSREVPTR